ncbi:hypothetical protein ACFYSJ_39495 [Streptomyces sp. NPDC005248]|uniref:hypothetical protein n=1 Tax=Streptomyces sp. NPDC005248 TaxID=3364709 RepID=UPI0036A9B68A
MQNAGRFASDSQGMNASRAVWIIAHGDPGDFHVLHSCNGGSGATGCINIRHLYLGDNEANKRDMVASGHTIRGKSHGNRGEAHGNAILSDDAVRDIRSRYLQGWPYHPGNKAALADEYGVSVKTIQCVLDFRTWKHV